MASCRLLMVVAAILSIIGCSHSQQLAVHWVSPRYGSVAGGTRVYIGGSGFQTDSYTGANLVFIGDTPCDVVAYTVTRTRLECITRPYPGAVEGQSSPWLPTRVISGGVQVLPTSSSTRFRYHWDNNRTPQVRTVLPSAAPVSLTDPLIEIAGQGIWPWSGTRYWQFYLGEQLCDHWNHDTNDVLGRRWYGGNHYVKCTVQETTPGAWNASVKMTDRGNTWNHSQSMMLGYDGKLSMFELYPDVHTVSPSTGSSTGGALLTITGLGFAETSEDVIVDVGGVPCEVVSVNTTVITCWTGVPSPGSEVIASEEGGTVTFTGVESGLRFEGTRGVKIERSSGSVYTHPPSMTAVFPSFEPGRTSRSQSYTERYTAFFTPVQSGRHTFFVSADDKGSLYTASGNNITNLTLIVETPWTPWDRWNYRSQQRSPVLNLTAGEPLLLLADNTETSGSDYLQVGVLMHDTDFYYNETTQSVREQQYVDFDTIGHYDNQRLVGVVNLTAVDDELPPEFVVVWGNRSAQITLQELQENKDALPSAVKDLFSGSCTFVQELGIIHFNKMVNQFETASLGSLGGWGSWYQSDHPEVVEDESYCGRQSLMIKGTRALFFQNLASGFRTSDYPFLCMAYKIPHGLPVTAAVQVKGYDWRSIAVTTTLHSFTSLGHWDNAMGADSIMDDDKWRYGCTNLHDLLQSSIITNDTTFTITGFGFRDHTPLNTSFHIDELSFSSEKRRIQNYLPPARPNGLALHSLLNSTVISVTDNILTISSTLQLVPASCDHNVPLMEFTLANASLPGVDEISVTRVQSASAPLSGTYSLGFKGHWTEQLPIDASTSMIKAALESLPGVPWVTVWYNSPHSKDMLGKYCPWRRLNVRFERTPGDQPLLELNTASLMGDALTTRVQETITGGLLLWPIPGHMLQTAERTPQVRVKVKGQQAACLGGHPQYSYQAYPNTDYCGFSYLASATPSVTSITPTSAAVGDTITIHGTGFSTTLDDNFVKFNEAECTVTMATETMLECTLGTGIAGTKTLYLHVLTAGVVDMTTVITLDLDLTLTSIALDTGSTEGGLVVMIDGSGFATPEDPPQGQSPGYSYSQFKMLDSAGCSSWANAVSIGGADCPIMNSTSSQLMCTTPVGGAAAVDVMVTVSCTDPGSTAVPVTETIASGFTYSTANTPTVTAITPIQGPGRGGTSITITGTGFSDTVTDNIVKLGGAVCNIQSATDTTIVCVTTPHSHGNVPVAVAVLTKGLATSTAEFNYLLHVTDISSCSGSLFGGQAVTIDGAGFLPGDGSGVGSVTVAMDGTQCDIQTASVTNDQITCVTRSAAITHRVNNNARNPEYGLGYLWESAALTITVGDSVRWSWTGSAFTPTKKLVQVEGPSSDQYNGYGFQSEASVRGSYTHLFTVPGTYHYITEGLAHIGFRGNITVVPPTTSIRPISITADGAAVTIDPGDICGTTPDNQYTFSITDTPMIDSISPSSAQPGDTLTITARAISTMAAHNMLTIGGRPCTASSHTSTTSSEPDITITSSTYTTDVITIMCTVPDTHPGRHRILLHVAGRGWGFGAYNDTTVLIRPSLTTPTPSSGSIRGGQLVSVPVTGLPRNFIGHTTIAIGNTPCLLQDITQSSTNPLMGNAVCLTQPARDDGYSALIKGTALVYWSLQADYYAPNGSFIDQEMTSFRSQGSVTPLASIVGTVSKRQLGISDNLITDQSAFFNRGHLRVQSFADLARLTSFSVELWVKIPSTTATTYRPIVSSQGVTEDDIPYGFLLMLNPCNQLEYWVSEGGVTATPSDEDCSIISNTDDCPSCASGRIIHSPTASNQLPEGVWHVVTSQVLTPAEQEWVHVVFGFQSQDVNLTHNCIHNSSIQLCTGEQVLYVNKTRYEDTTLYRRVTDTSNLIIGGTNLLPTSSPGSSQLGHFEGYIDEIAVYDHVLEQSTVDGHHHYGSTDEQPVIITTDSLGVGTDWDQDTAEWEPVFDTVHTPIDLETVDSGVYTLTENTAVQFTWTGYRGVWEVTRSVYMSCDLHVTPVKVWAPRQKGGGVLVGLETGRSYYFIDPVGDHCETGKKAKVTVGTEMVIEWELGSHDDITVTEGTGLVFRWSGPVAHNVLEMSSERSVTDCPFVKRVVQNRDSGQVKRAWQAMPIARGDVAVTGLSVGKHYFVCTVDSHCDAGMRFTVTVEATPGGPGAESTESPQVHTIPWRIQSYPPMRITEGDTLRFAWSAFHSLHQVSKESFTSCNTAATSLFVWGNPSVDNSVSLSDLTPGTYYFTCVVSGHCDAGMKLQVTVTPRGVSVLERPLRAECEAAAGQCSFRYDVDETPELISVEPSTSVLGGGSITLTGRGLLSASTTATVGAMTTDTMIWVGPTHCNSVTISAVNGIDIELMCTLLDYEMGNYSIDVHVSDKGQASLSPSLLAYGPIRNASLAANTYPQVWLSSQATSISPTIGSMEGGTLLTITGSGFSFFPSRVTVSLGSIPCDVVTSTLTEITCRSGASVVTTDTTLPLSVLINDSPASTSVMYSYTTADTPTITSLSPGTDLGGGETIHITGTGFSTTASDMTVQILEPDQAFMFSGTMGVACTVTTVTATTIDCTAPTLSAGTYRAVVHTSGRGLAREASPNAAIISYALSVTLLTPNQGGHGGGLVVTIEGSGFPTNTVGSISDVSISVWAVGCSNVQSISSTQMTCTVDPSGTTPPLADIGAPVVVSYRGVETTPVTFTYTAGLTAELTSVTPLVGGTGGGTMVNITGTGLLPVGVTTPEEDDVIVTIDSAVCRWHGIAGITPPSESLITCRTSQHSTTPQAEVKVFIKGKGYALTSDSIYYRYIDLWSSKFTWGGLEPPKEGESVHIRAGQTVFLDTSTPVLNLIVIEGSLLFYDEQNIHFQARYIFISGGRLQVGTEASPFKHRAIISLHGNVRDPEIPIYGAKVIGVRQGELDLHGCRRNITWTRLAQTAFNGTSELYLQQPVDWKSNDRIVIAPTVRDGNETEVRTVMSVSDDGLTVTMTTSLTYTHHGYTEQYENGHHIDIRAEVGLLSHNVIIQGSQLIGNDLKGLGADQYGGQVFVHRTGPHPTPIRIEHTEFRFMGQAFRLGRYAIHFHLSGSMNGSYLRNCAIHHSHNRALTVHGSHDLIVEGNVAYDIKGHTYFIEDGVETNNHYRRNLGVLTRSSSSLLNTDQLPATFWITNPQNTFIDNAAVASRAYGFWYDLDSRPSGASYGTSSVCPNKMPFGTFRNNVAHSCGEFGLRIWESYTPFLDGCGAKQPQNATLYDFTTYANGIHGVEMSVVGNIRLVGFKIADNRDNGIEIQETNGVWGGPLIKDTLIASSTSVNPLPPGTGGIKAPQSPYLTISNVTFAAFTQPNAACFKACSHCKAFQGGFQVWTEQLSFVNGSASNKASFKWEHEVLFRDLDGTLTGLADGGWVTPNSGLHPPDHCTPSVPEFSIGGFNGSMCTSDVYFIRMAWNQATPTVTLLDIGVNVTNQFGSSIVPWREKRLTHPGGYMVTLPSTHSHTLTWLLPPNKLVDVMSYGAGLYGLRPVDYVTITHHFVMIPNHVNIGGNRMPTEHGGVPTNADPNHSWHIDNTTTNSTTYLITGINRTQQYFDTVWGYSYEPCPIDGCPDPPDPNAGPQEDNYRRWSNPDSWQTGELPKEGEDVTISSSWRMLLDLTPPPLGRVFVFGELKFEDERDYNFTANLILVRGGNSHLVVGEEGRPFTHQATITLTGRRNDAPLSLGNQVILGSKAVGVFGNVSMYGQPVVQPWTRLAATAAAASTDIRIQGNVNDWLAGDRIVIASSSYEPLEAEIRTILSYDPDTQLLMVDEPLTHDHVVHSFLSSEDVEQLNGTSPWWNDNSTMAPEVGLLSRNILIQGGEDPVEPLEFHHYGCRILIGRYRSTLGIQYSGFIKMEGVEVRHCGQGGYHSPRDPRYSIAFRNNFGNSVGSFIRGCSIHHGYNTAIGVHTSNGVTVSQNVVYRTTGSSIIVGGAGSVVSGNLAMVTSTVQPNRPKDNHAVDFPATYDVDRGNTVRNNAAAGTNRISYRYGGERCHGDQQPMLNETAMFWNNTAHSGLMALLVLGIPDQCTSIAGLTATHHWDYAIFSSTASSLVASHLKLAAGKVGLSLNVFGPDPVAHELGGKSVTVLDSLIVGSLPGQSCMTSPPSHVIPGVSFGAAEDQLGIMMSCFNKKRSKMDGTGRWHLMKQYPVIDGLSSAIRVTFARFQSTSGCGYQSVAIGSNRLSPDATHPLHMRDTTKLSVDMNSLVLFYDPDPGWINQEDCIDMDCDGPKHSLIRDLDGSFLGLAPSEGSVVPRAELRFDDYIHRLPVTWLDYATPGNGLASPNDVIQNRGVARGHPTDFNAASGGCEWVESWNAYRCQRLRHLMLVIESMDADTEVRRLSPIALVGGDTGGGAYTDLINGPMDHGWCTSYTCLKRLSTFFTLVSAGTSYHLWSTGSLPGNMRFHLLNAEDDDVIMMSVWYKSPLRKDVYRNGIFIEASNVEYEVNGVVRSLDDSDKIPSQDDPSGTNYFDRATQMLHLIIEGSDAIEVRSPPVIRVSFTLDVTIDDFFTTYLIDNLALVLGIEPSTIRVVNVISENSPRNRRSLLAVDSTIVLELGEPAEPNITEPVYVTVGDQMDDDEEGETDSVDIAQPTDMTTTASTNPLNDDAPSNVTIFAAQYNSSAAMFVEELADYFEDLEKHNNITMIVDELVQQVQTGNLTFENATILGLSVLSAPPPAPPTPPVVPPEYENVTTSGNVTLVEVTAPPPPPVVSSGGSDTELSFSIPTALKVLMQPHDVTSHLVYVSLTMLDSSGNIVRNLGLVNKWTCVATQLESDNNAMLEGVTNVTFSNGTAVFTRLRVDRPSTDLRLHFRTFPAHFTAISFPFTVISPPTYTPQGVVGFTLALPLSDGRRIPSDYNALIGVIRTAVSAQLDIDISRVGEIILNLQPDKLVVRLSLLERLPTDPPDVPLLNNTLNKLEQLVNSQQLQVTIDDITLVSQPGSFINFTSSNPSTIPLVLIIVIAASGGGALVAVVIIAFLCLCTKGIFKLKDKKNRKKVAPQAGSSTSIVIEPNHSSISDSDDECMLAPLPRPQISSSTLHQQLPNPDAYATAPIGNPLANSTSHEHGTVDPLLANTDCWSTAGSTPLAGLSRSSLHQRQSVSLAALANSYPRETTPRPAWY